MFNSMKLLSEVAVPLYTPSSSLYGSSCFISSIIFDVAEIALLPIDSAENMR